MNHIHPILLRLTGGDRRSVGYADAVAAEVIADLRLFSVVVRAMTDADPLIRMRAADAVEKASRIRPEMLKPHKRLLLRLLSQADQQEVRWHLAQMVPRLSLNRSQRVAALAVLERDLAHDSRIVRVNAMQAMADLAATDDRLRSRVIVLIKERINDDSAAMRARARVLLSTCLPPA